MNTPSVTVLILNYNGIRYLKRFLPSVLGTRYPYFDVVVADNASTDGSQVYLRECYPQVTLLEFAENFGFADGNNRALQACKGDYIVLLNSDVEVHPGWLSPLVHLAEENPKVAAIQPKILAENNRGSFEYAGAAGGFIDMLGYAFCRGRVLQHTELDLGQYDSPKPVFWATGACLFLRAATIRQTGLFDPRYFAHYEEIDLCWRLQNSGFEVWVQPNSVVYHVGGGTLPQGSPRKTFLNFRNSLATLWKNLPPEERAWKLVVRLGLDWVAAAKELATGKPKIAAAILKAHWGFVQLLDEAAPSWVTPTVRKPMKELSGVFEGSILWRVIVRKQTKFSDLPSKRFF
jgi:GT2 family glycosyltransferase